MDEYLDIQLASDFAVALLIGALIGVEREKRKLAENDQGIGGLRTFILIAEAGALSAWLALQLASPWILALGGLSMVGLVTAGYVLQVRAGAASMGLTTEVAAITTFLLGAVCLAGHTGLAVALAIVTSAVLAWKQPLHSLVARVGTEDLYAGIKLLVATFIVLPLLPRDALDPWGALVPYELWLLAVLIAALSLVGYVAVRWLGPGRGTAVTGFFGGLVSSTAVTLTFARRSHDDDQASGGADALAAGLALAWAVMFVRVVGIVFVLYRPLALAVVGPFTAMAAGSLASAAWWYRQAMRGSGGGSIDVPLKNPFSLRAAVSFAALFAVVLLAVQLARQYLPAQSLYAVATLAGLTDVDAITLSMATDARRSGDIATAARAITLAALSNTVVKAGLGITLGSPALRTRVAVVVGLVAAAAGASWLLGG